MCGLSGRRVPGDSGDQQVSAWTLGWVSEHSSPSFESTPVSGTWGWGTWHPGRLKVCKVAEPRGTEGLLLAGGVHSFPSVITVSRAAIYAGLARSGRGA